MKSNRGMKVARPTAGDGLLHPVALASLALLIANDHLFKHAYPGFVTGKLSDFAGLVFFPLLLQALYELGAALVGRPSTASPRALLLGTVAAGVVFCAVKIAAPVNDVGRELLGWLQWAAGWPIAMASGVSPEPPASTAIALDVTDLVALPALLIAYALGRWHRSERHLAALGKSPAIRRFGAISVLVTAGVAALATTQIPTVESHATGSVTVSRQPSELRALVSLDRPAGTEFTSSQLEFASLGGYVPNPEYLPSSSLSSAAEARFTLLSGDGGQTAWMGLPAYAAVATDQCGNRGRCELDYLIEVRSIGQSEPFTLKWQLDSYVSYSGSATIPADGFSIVVTGSTSPTPIIELMSQGALAGVLSGIAVVLALALFPRASRRTLVELSAAGVMLVAGLYLLVASPPSVLLIGAPLIMALAGVIVAGQVFARRSRWRPMVLFLPIVLPMPWLISSIFGSIAVYRDEQVFVGLFAAGCLGVVGMTVLIAEIRSAIGSLDRRNLRLWLTLAAAASLLVITIGHGLGAAVFPELVLGATGPAATAALVGIALCLLAWLRTGTRALAVIGIFMPAIGALVYPWLALLLLTSNRGDDIGAYAPWIAMIGIGLALAVLAWRPPRRADDSSREDLATDRRAVTA